MLKRILFFSFLILVIGSCKKDETVTPIVPPVVIDDTDFDIPDWTSETHTKDVDPNFDEVFEDNTVKRLDITITKERWKMMKDDLTSKFGALGSSPFPGALIEAEKPIYVPAEVFYEGKEWYRVGLRFKGNSSLQFPWKSGIMKLPIKLDFDEFEDTYPQIDNQRFYGFKKLHLKNNFGDGSYIREKVVGEIFDNAGIPTAHTAFYKVYIDFGEGSIYFGLYTLVEEISDSLLEDQFEDDNGNLYKPDGSGASFAEGSFNESFFAKKSNKSDADWSDIQNLFAVLHSGDRLSDPALWRTNLDATFDTDIFLKYLAINTTIQNWDSYGRMTHNYYLYNNPVTNKLTWIPWDHNEAMQNGNVGLPSPLAIDFSDMSSSSDWPLIGYLYEDPIYKAKYDSYLQNVVDGYFNVSTIQATYNNMSDLIESSATSETSGYTFINSFFGEEFNTSINTLKNHVTQRTEVVNDYLD